MPNEQTNMKTVERKNVTRGFRRRLVIGLAAGAIYAVSVSSVFTPSALADGLISYTVQPGDTLLGIASLYGVSPDQIASSSGLNDPNVLRIGQTLTIPASVSTAAVSPSSQASSILSAPYYSQFDGSDYSASNCGPTSLSMALGSLGIDAEQMWLRHWADVQMGTNDPSNGTTWEALSYAAGQAGAATSGLYGDSGYHTWSIAELKAALAQGHPVLLLVRYWDMPGHGSSGYAGDHYVVALGVDGDGNIVYHDPAFAGSGDGADRAISPADLRVAWGDTMIGLVQTAMVVYK